MLTYIIAVLLQLVFLYNFFQINEPKAAAPVPPPASIDDITFNLTQVYPKPETELVFLLIDGLRYDFVTADLTPFLHRTASCMINVEVPSPTVTLPRIKTLTTGEIPQFSDVFANLLQLGGDSNATTDSFLHRAVAAQRKVVFYGDDTWTKLYPEGVFERSEATSGWNVMDFVEADRNVTRNVEAELARFDWDVMVLHYSGLDHIGHVHGPRHALVAEKLVEMDRVVERIVKNRNAIVIVTGDHGMKDTGSHGGSTYPETHVPLALIGTACTAAKAIQSDIVPTLSILLGLPIPSGNVGGVIPSLLPRFDTDRLLYALRYSCLQLHPHAQLDRRATLMHQNFLMTQNASSAIEAAGLYEKFLEEARDRVMRHVAKRSVTKPVLTVLVQVACLFGFASQTRSVAVVFMLLVVLLLPCPYAYAAGCFALLFIAAKVRATLSIVASHKKVVTLGAVYILSLGSTSFIEQEQLFWYHLGSSVLLLAAYQYSNEKLLVFCVIFRLLQFRALAAEVSIIPLGIITFCRQFSYPKLVIISLIYVFRTYYADNTSLARLIWFLILFHSISRRPYHRNHLTDTWILTCTMLLRPHNLVLLPFCIYASRAILLHLKHPEYVALSHICLAKTLFFLHGHSNSLASIDFASGYVGASEYSFVAVFAKVLCHTYAFPVLCGLLVLEKCSERRQLGKVYGVKAGLQLATLVFCCVQMVVHREHLFVWTVFAPKLVMESAHSAVLVVEVVIAYAVNYLSCKQVEIIQ